MMITPRLVISSALGIFLAAAVPRATWFSAASTAPRATSPDPGDELVILPEQTVLRGKGARQQLLIERRAGGSFVGPHTEDATFSSSNPNVATVDESGVVTAVGDGRAILAAKAGGRSSSTVIEVERASARYPVSFRNHVVPVLTKAGCNSGPLPRRSGGKERVQVDAAGIRPRARLSDADAAGGRATRQQGRSGDQSNAAETDGGRLSWGRQTLLAALARVSRDCGLDRVRHACAGGIGPGDDALGGVSRVRAAGRRHRAATRGSRALLRRSCRGYYALGEVLDERERGCRRRSAWRR